METLEKLFVYGELCKLEVLRRVLERVPAAVPALLPEHARRRGAHGFFEVVPAAGVRTAGLVLAVSSRELARLDVFEDVDGGLYRRVTRRVRMLGTGTEDVDAWVYLAPPP